MRRSDADEYVTQYFLAHDRLATPGSLHGRLVRDDLVARQHPGASLAWPSRSTRHSDERYHVLAWIVAPVPELAMRVMRELLLGVGEIVQRPVRPVVLEKPVCYEAVTLRPTNDVIARRVRMPTAVVRAAIQEARIIVAERAAQLRWRQAA
jgi:hypothetical protein